MIPITIFKKGVKMAKVVIYSKTYCPYCDKAKNLFQSKGQSFQEIRITDENIEDFQKLQEKTGMRTVPQIFINDKFIGGFQELAHLNNQGNLDPLLK